MTCEFPIPSSLSSTHRDDMPSELLPLNIGDRMRQLNGVHELIWIKVGPSMAADELVQLLDSDQSPNRKAGKVTLITRYGAAKIESHLAGHINSVQLCGHPIAWICDPMLSNTLTSSSGLKMCNFGTINSELTTCILEFTEELSEDGFSVTECLGVAWSSPRSNWGCSTRCIVVRFQSFCDSHLNFEQSLNKSNVAFLISNHYNRRQVGRKRADSDVLYAELGGRKFS
ncbi:uncharacterized protein LAESUDRAFT_739320 [Laetiporus sulphureus 93-53]|uniref:Phospho-2-dehydro-3-deoxyheptonate aldolase n=1 Tax=Laetiporus sulphureus 93-53 TaxID=1314785 RepID=A0A165BI10_9APHY|nr:uncharacterized protein LAESUDRAFT_739320 [Laetiporus sulphureus 93-53]KZT01098.1 hypothetical protein LAESUDRAFT_739320 [Laetiporus sulphureus 93-53]